MEAKPMKPLFGGGEKEGQKSGGIFQKILLPVMPAIVMIALLLTLGLILKGPVSDWWFEFNSDNRVLEKSLTVGTKPGMGLSIKTENPDQAKYVFARYLLPGGRKTPWLQLDQTMATDIVMDRQFYVEIQVGTGKNIPKGIRLLVKYYRHKS